MISVCSACGPNSNGSKLRELESLQQGVPVFETFVETSVHKTSKSDLAGISKLYKSAAPYDDVKRFYVSQMTDKGWEYTGEQSILNWGEDRGARTLAFRCGEYRLSIFYTGEDPEYRYRYAIEIGWGK
jgi:hypothetical protein